MVDGPDGRGDGTELQIVVRALTDTVPLLVERLSRARYGRIYREALELLERPLIGHVLAMTGGTQLRAARVLGLNRNTLRKRCRELHLALPREPRRAPAAPLR
jgi:DNA-binding protein Fis